MFFPSSKRRVARTVLKTDLVRAFADAEGIVRAAFADAPRSSGDPDALPDTSVLADIVDALASEYGWPASTILDLPLCSVWQLYHCIMRRRHGGARARAMTLSGTESAIYLDALNNASAKKHE